MRFAIPLFGDRVAPRCTFADSVLLVAVKYRRVAERDRVPLASGTWVDLLQILTDREAGTMICGGVSPSTRESIEAQGVRVIDNVAGSVDEVVEALCRGRLKAGFGLSTPAEAVETAPAAHRGGRTVPGVGTPARSEPATAFPDCLACEERICLRGEPCPWLLPGEAAPTQAGVRPDLEALLEPARDVAYEEERTLCRLAELVYFALGAGYERLGVAFCIELLEPTTILVKLLRRFFEVLPVCCKLGGIPGEPAVEGGDPIPRMASVCDPLGQAQRLNRWGAQLNVVVGLCVGVDCAFTRASDAPVTTVFVKDRSLANNPIGAVYSHYYLQEI
jgi:uncharacterized metal-binding protein/predicted Fe-Mo cluster-binding NifX family protein